MDHTLPILSAIAARLAGRAVADVEPGGRGGNNRLYRVRCRDGSVFALKSYPRLADDTRDRLGNEFRALSFLGAHGVEDVPAALARDDETGFGLFEWVEGGPVVPGTADIDRALAFAARLHALRGEPGAAAIPWASEASRSGAEIVAQVGTRLDRLRAVAPAHPGLTDMLEGGIAPALARLTPAAEGVSPPPSERTLSPADFGFHNALRRADGTLVFLDFEYFGWDDPVKLAAEFTLHPGHVLDESLSARWRAGISLVYGDLPGFAGRLAVLGPLFALRWALIVLNEFLPERWARRVAAGAGDGGAGDAEAETVRARQLDKARRLLERVIEG